MRQKRFLSWLLTLCLLLGMFSFPAYADGNTTTNTISGDGTADKTGTMTITLVIPKKTPAATDLTYTAPSGLTYSGSDKAATVAAASGVTGMGTITVKYYSDASRSTEVTETKNVGTYYVGATVAEGDQYAASTAVLYGDGWTFTITASTPSAPAAPTKASATKNSITLNAVSGCEYSKDGSNWQSGTEFTGLLPGTEYTFYQRVKATANTNASPASSAKFSTEADTYAMTITLVIKPAQTITASDVTATYGDTDKSVSGTTSGDGAISYSVKSGDAVTVDENTGALTIAKAGSAVITVTAAETATYAQATKDVNVTVNKAAPTVTAPTAKTLTYTGSAQALVNAGSTNDGTIKYAVTTENKAPTDESLYTTTIPTGTDARTYYVWYKVHGDDNHNDTNPVCVILRISSPPSGPSTISATVTFKVAHGAWDDGTKDNKTVTLTGYSPLTLSTSQIPAVGSKPDEGYKAGSWDTVPATSITRSTIYTYSYVKKPAATITKEPTACDLTENGKPQELVTAGEATGGTMEYALGVTADGWSTSIPTATNAGVYYVWYKVVGDADHSSTEPKCIVVTVKYGPGTLIYNGKEQELVKPGTVQGGTMVYVLGTHDVTAPGEGWTDVIPKGKEVGDYYVWYKVLGDENHKDTEPRCIKVTIVPDSQVQQFEELIKTLPEKVTLENSDLVKALRALYDSLSDDQKKLILEEDVRKLEAAEEKISELNGAAAERFTIAVNSIPRSEAGEGKGMLDAATEIYNNITEEQKALVSDDTMALYNEAIAAFKKDRQFRSGDGYYKVLSNGDVTYLKPASKDITNVTVPNQVKKGKFLFKVIKVSNNAFRNCGNLKWAVIGNNVRVFGEYVFARAYNLKKVRVLGYGFKSGKVTNAFVKAGKKGKLTVKVPGNKVDEYRELFTGEGKLNGKVEAA